jgi:hypothetical protein
MGAQSFQLLALSATAAFLNLVMSSGSATSAVAVLLAGAFKILAIGLFATVVALRAVADPGPFSDPINFALVGSLVSLGTWCIWSWLEEEPAAEETSDDDSF